MTNTPAERGAPPPEPRIGDADRDRAVSFLQEHLAQGRIDAAEFDERMGQALRARTASELAVLFRDLPEPRPADAAPMLFQAPPWSSRPGPASRLAPASPPEPPVAAQNHPALNIITAVIWPVTILTIFILGWGDFWWLVFVPIIVTSALGKSWMGRRDHHHRRRALGD